MLKIILKKLKKGRPVVGIHTRRGDHLALGYLRFSPPKYFQKAKKYFQKIYNDPVFVVATNDRDWAEQNFTDENTFIISHTKNPVEDMAILAGCNGVIMSLGTFGWWGGWLCGGPVIYYKNEIDMNHKVNKGKIKNEDYYPENWIKRTL